MPQKKPAAASIPDKVACIYDRFATLSGAATWGDSMHVGYWDNPDSEIPLHEAVNRLTDITTEKLKIGPESHVLDVGCGVGGPGVRIARLTGARVTGISISREQVTRANSLAESAGLSDRVVFRQENAMEMAFPEHFFDAAIALESMIHMPDRGQVLTQICRSLQPGGRLVLTDSFARAPIPIDKLPAIDRFCNDFMCTMVQAEDYPPLLRGAGLRFEEILDISEQTIRKSFTWFSEWIRGLQPELNAMHGEEMTNRFDTMDLIDIRELGYLMVVAKRPNDEK